MQKVTSNQFRELVKLIQGINVLLFGTGFLAPLIQSLTHSLSVSIHNLSIILLSVGSACFILAAFCWYLTGIADHYEQRETKCDHFTEGMRRKMYE